MKTNSNNHAKIIKTGDRIFYLTVLDPKIGNNKSGSPIALVRCDCGKEFQLLRSSLNGNTKSCGCQRKRLIGEAFRLHGHCSENKRSKIYSAWINMMVRCYRTTHKHYPSYGGRGISVSEEWHEFENFLRDMKEPPTEEHSLDRIDNNKGYAIGNCRWATKREQQNNRRTNVVLTLIDQKDTMTNWCRRLGLKLHIVRYRIKKGWSHEKALLIPDNFG